MQVPSPNWGLFYTTLFHHLDHGVCPLNRRQSGSEVAPSLSLKQLPRGELQRIFLDRNGGQVLRSHSGSHQARGQEACALRLDRVVFCRMYFCLPERKSSVTSQTLACSSWRECTRQTDTTRKSGVTSHGHPDWGAAWDRASAS